MGEGRFSRPYPFGYLLGRTRAARAANEPEADAERLLTPPWTLRRLIIAPQGHAHSLRV